MLPPVNGSTEEFLVGLARVQSTLDTVQRRLSSGVRVGRPSDDPAAVPLILDNQAQIAHNNQAQSNLSELKVELTTGDSALQQAIKAVESAISLAAQGGSTFSSPQPDVLLTQAKGIQEFLVGVSRTTAGGRYIFSGDLDQKPLYALDPTQPEGVRQLATATSTRVISDDGGSTIWAAKTAQEIFDPRNLDNSAASGNVFVAINNLVTALQNNDAPAAQAAGLSLKAADEHLNQQLGLYGIAETRVDDAVGAGAKSIVTETQELSNLRDADVAGGALQLSQANLQMEAALSARAKTAQLSLFNYLA